MRTLIAPGPWHYTAEDHVVRDVNGSPIAAVLSRHPGVHAELIAALPTTIRLIEDGKDILIRELREKLFAAEAEARAIDDSDEQVAHWRMTAEELGQALDEANKRIAELEKALRSMLLRTQHESV